MRTDEKLFLQGVELIENKCVTFLSHVFCSLNDHDITFLSDHSRFSLTLSQLSALTLSMLDIQDRTEASYIH